MLCILYGNGNEISINLSKLNYIRQEFRCTLYIYECKENPNTETLSLVSSEFNAHYNCEYFDHNKYHQ